LAGLLAASVVVALGWLAAPFVRATVDLARLPEYVNSPGFGDLLAGEIAKDIPKGPVLTLLAWSREIQREEPFADDNQDFRPTEPATQSAPESQDKPVSMRLPERRRIFLADKDA